MNRADSAVSDAAHYAENVRFSLEGEVQRRVGLAKSSATSGTSVTNYWHPTAGFYVIFATSTGTLEAVSP